MAAPPVDYSRLKVLLLLEAPGAAVLTHTLRCGTHNTPPADIDHYLAALPPHPPVNYSLLSAKAKKKAFDASQTRQIRNNASWDNLDVTLLHRAIFLACEGVAREGDAKWQAPAELEGLVTKIKSKRNEIIHERTAMTQQLFAATVAELEDAFDRILTAVEARYNVPHAVTTRVRDEVRSSVDSIKSCFDVETLWRLGEAKLLPQFIDASRRHLKSLFQHVEDFDPLCFLKGRPRKKFPIQDMFSRLLVKTKPQDVQLDCVDLLSLTLPPRPNAPPQPPLLNAPSQLVVVSGPAGSGKTTLLAFIFAAWVDDQPRRRVPGLDAYDLVLRVLCRESDAASLEKFAALVLPDSFVRRPNVVSLLKKCRVLFLIDGLDEVNDTSRRLVSDILNYCKTVPQFTAVCTARPETTDDFLDSAPQVRGRCEVVLQGVEPADRTNFVLTQYRLLAPGGAPDPGQESKLRDVMADIGWREHLSLPLNLLFVATLFVEDPGRVTASTTQTGLYAAMHAWCVERLHHRLAAKVTAPRLRREAAVKAVLRRMYLVSLQGLLQDRLWLSEQDVQDLDECCAARSLPAEDLIAAFFSLRRSVRHGVTRSRYYAPHKGLQEFYAALHIVGQLEAGSAGRGTKGLLQDCLQTQEVNLRAQRNLLLHELGLLSQPERPPLPRATEEAVDLLAESGVERCEEWLSLLAATEANEEVFRRVAHHVSGSSEGESVRVTAATVCSAAALLPFLPPQDLRIELEREARGLEEALAAFAGHRCTRLHLRDHFRNPGQTAASGPLLQRLPDRRHLRSFEGHLDAEDLALLPGGLEELSLAVVLDSGGRELLPALEHAAEAWPLLNLLIVNVPVLAATPGCLTPLPRGPRVVLVLPCVGDHQVAAACRTAGRVCPAEEGYWSVQFPGASLGAGEWRQLVEGMAASGVRVHGGRLALPLNTVTRAEQIQLYHLAKASLGCEFRMWPEELLWGVPAMARWGDERAWASARHEFVTFRTQQEHLWGITDRASARFRRYQQLKQQQLQQQQQQQEQ